MMPPRHKPAVLAAPWTWALVISAAMVALRMVHLAFLDTSLGADEAQYWFWSRTFDWGYYSKPPMIGWVISLSTSLFGETTFGVRALSPLFLSGTGLALFAAGKTLFGPRAGLASLVLWHSMPAVIYGGTLISTDIPMLAFYAASFLGLLKTIEAEGRKKDLWALFGGAALGLAMMSKYAAIYFFIGAGLAYAVSPYLRRGVGPRQILTFGAAFAALFAPNAVWNLRNGLQTVKHTADNANWSGKTFHLDQMGDFLASQFGVLGPLLFAALLLIMVRERFRGDGKAALLISFVLPPLLIISLQALLSRAHANWALTAYVPALLLLPFWLGRTRLGRGVLVLSTLFHGAVGALLVYLSTDLDRAEGLGLSNSVKRLRAWEETAAALGPKTSGYSGLLTDEREWTAHFVWEFRDEDLTIAVFDENERTDSTYEYAMPLVRRAGERWLYVSATPPERLSDTQLSLEPQLIETLFIDLHAERRGIKERTLFIYEVAF